MTSTASQPAKRPRESVEVLADYPLPTAPGQSLIMLRLYIPPGGWTPPHRHGGATVVATVLQGAMLSGMNGDPPRVYKPGESFREMPGCHHTVADNASETEEMLAVVSLVVDSKVVEGGRYDRLTVLDEGWE